MSRHTRNVLQCLRLLISHQMKYYRSDKAIGGLSCTYCRVFWVLGKLGETGPHYPYFFHIFQFYYPDIRDFKFIFHNRVDELLWSNGSGDIGIAI